MVVGTLKKLVPLHCYMTSLAAILELVMVISSWIKSGVPAGRLVMGMPKYGRTWQLKNPNEHKIGDPAVGTGLGNGGITSYDDIVEFNLVNGATEVYDNDTVSTYSYVVTNWI